MIKDIPKGGYKTEGKVDDTFIHVLVHIFTTTKLKIILKLFIVSKLYMVAFDIIFPLSFRDVKAWY